MENFVTANIIGSLSRYWPESRLREFLDPIKFLQSSLLEYSYPKSFEAYKEMTKSLELYISDFCLGKNYLDLLHSIPHQSSEMQSHPINWEPSIRNSPNLELLNQVEV